MPSVRAAIVKDIPRLVEMGFSFYSKSAKGKGLRYSEKDFTLYLLSLMNSPAAILLVSTEGNEITGSISGLICPWFMDFSQRMMIEQWWWTEPGSDPITARSLLRHLINWSKSQGCTKLIMVSISPEEDRVKRHYNKMGYTHMECHFIKEI